MPPPSCMHAFGFDCRSIFICGCKIIVGCGVLIVVGGIGGGSGKFWIIIWLDALLFAIGSGSPREVNLVMASVSCRLAAILKNLIASLLSFLQSILIIPSAVYNNGGVRSFLAITSASMHSPEPILKLSLSKKLGCRA